MISGIDGAIVSVANEDWKLWATKLPNELNQKLFVFQIWLTLMLVERWYTNTPKETCVMIELDSCLSICFYFIHFFSTQFRMIGSFSRIIINGVDFFLLKW